MKLATTAKTHAKSVRLLTGVTVIAISWLSASRAPAEFLFNKVITNGASVPGVSNTTFIGFGGPNQSNGTLVFIGNWNGGRGVFTYKDSVTKVMASGEILPSIPMSFFSFGNEPTIEGGRVAFYGNYSGGPIPNGFIYQGIFTSSLNNTTKVAIHDDPVPVGGSTYDIFSEPIVHGGNVIFRAASNDGIEGIYSYNNGIGSRSIASTELVPGLNGQTFDLGFGTSMPRGSNLVFTGVWNSGSGVFLKSGATISKFMETGDAVPGAPGQSFSSLGAVDINDTNVVAYGQWSNGNKGLFRYDGNDLIKLVATGDLLPGSLAKITNVQPIASLSGGDVVYRVDFGGNFALIYQAEGKAPVIVLTGSSILFGSQVNALAIGQDALEGRQLTLSYGLLNGEYGIATVVVPEPSTAVLCLIAAVGFLLVRCRSHGC